MLRKRDICMTTTDVHSIVRVVIVNTMVLYVDNEELDIPVSKFLTSVLARGVHNEIHNIKKPSEASSGC